MVHGATSEPTSGSPQKRFCVFFSRHDFAVQLVIPFFILAFGNGDEVGARLIKRCCCSSQAGC